VSPVKTAEPIKMPFGLRTLVGPENHVLDGGPDPLWQGTILGGRAAIVSIWTFCRELCKNGWMGRFAAYTVDWGWPKEAQVQSYSPGGANCAHMGRHIGATWRIRFSRPSAAAMRSCVKSLWPLVICLFTHLLPACHPANSVKALKGNSRVLTLSLSSENHPLIDLPWFANRFMKKWMLQPSCRLSGNNNNTFISIPP